MARIEAMAKCWYGAEEYPYQPSLVTVVSSSLPASTAARVGSGNTTSYKIAVLPRWDPTANITAPTPAENGAKRCTRGATNLSHRCRGKNSPNGTKCTLRYTAAVRP